MKKWKGFIVIIASASALTIPVVLIKQEVQAQSASRQSSAGRGMVEAKLGGQDQPSLARAEQPHPRELTTRIVRVAAVQISPVLYSREGTVEKVVRKIHELHQQGVQFVTFPETLVPYYPYFSFVQTPVQNIVGPEHWRLLDQAVTVPSPATEAISEAARQTGMVVSIGVNERDGGTLYNTQLLFDADGTLIGGEAADWMCFRDAFEAVSDSRCPMHSSPGSKRSLRVQSSIRRWHIVR